MKDKHVIDYQYLPSRLPIPTTFIAILYIKVFNVTGVWLGVLITLLVLWWVASIFAIAREKNHAPVFTTNNTKRQEIINALIDKIGTQPDDYTTLFKKDINKK